jgi:hypothetical protein
MAAHHLFLRPPFVCVCGVCVCVVCVCVCVCVCGVDHLLQRLKPEV